MQHRYTVCLPEGADIPRLGLTREKSCGITLSLKDGQHWRARIGVAATESVDSIQLVMPFVRAFSFSAKSWAESQKI